MSHGEIQVRPRGIETGQRLMALQKIPEVDKGRPAPRRVRWFRTFAMKFSQIYDEEAEPVEMKIELEAANCGGLTAISEAVVRL